MSATLDRRNKNVQLQQNKKSHTIETHTANIIKRMARGSRYRSKSGRRNTSKSWLTLSFADDAPLTAPDFAAPAADAPVNGRSLPSPVVAGARSSDLDADIAASAARWLRETLRMWSVIGSILPQQKSRECHVKISTIECNHEYVCLYRA